MRKLKSHQFNTGTNSHYSKYDWDKLLDGNIWKVSPAELNPREGEDLTDTLKRFRRTAHAAATVRDLKLQTQIVDDSYLVIQARPLG